MTIKRVGRKIFRPTHFRLLFLLRHDLADGILNRVLREIRLQIGSVGNIHFTVLIGISRVKINSL